MKLNQIIKENVNLVIKENIYNYSNILNKINIDELMKNGETNVDDWFIYSYLGGNILEISIYNPINDMESKVKVGLQGNDWEEEYKYGVEQAFKKLNNLNESKLKYLIKETTERVLQNMSNNIYTMNDWHNDKRLNLKVGQFIDNEVFQELLDNVRPTTYNSKMFQVGEADTHNIQNGKFVLLFKTFIKTDGLWQYIGLCPEGETKSYNSSNLNESKLKSYK